MSERLVTMNAYKQGDAFQVGPLIEGMYISAAASTRSFRQSDVSCPYCREPMTEARDSEPRRIVRIVDRLNDHEAEVVCVSPPESHRMFGCATCHAVFTMPDAAVEPPRRRKA